MFSSIVLDSDIYTIRSLHYDTKYRVLTAIYSAKIISLLASINIKS
jgi:hypothetical protein